MNILLQSIFIVFCTAALAQDGDVIRFRGQVADQADQPPARASPVTIVFWRYQAPVGGAALWEEAQPAIGMSAGRFSVLLGVSLQKHMTGHLAGFTVPCTQSFARF